MKLENLKIFENYLEKELKPALEELSEFSNEKSRKHIQKTCFYQSC
ncbi:Uncharacterised protein [Legionella sainthelensi]|nr:Uncharacterised protein [Legionella sainthelensi]